MVGASFDRKTGVLNGEPATRPGLRVVLCGTTSPQRPPITGPPTPWWWTSLFNPPQHTTGAVDPPGMREMAVSTVATKFGEEIAFADEMTTLEL